MGERAVQCCVGVTRLFCIPGTSLLGVMILFREGHFFLLWQSDGSNSCRVLQALPSRQFPLLFSPESACGPLVLEGRAVKTQSVPVLRQQRQPGGSWQGTSVLCCLGLGSAPHVSELHHHIAFVPKGVRAAGRNGLRLPLSGETT